MNALVARFQAWMRRLMPSREQLERNRLVRPFARRHELWRFNRRSVPRGVAVGLFVGILALIPGLQIIGAALMCVPCRGNIPIAAAVTFLSNPATTPLIIAASFAIGGRLGFPIDLATFHQLYATGAGLRQWSHWLLSDAGPSLLVGLLALSCASALTGYVVACFAWRWWIGHKRQARVRSRADGHT